MTNINEWGGAVGDVWADEWQRTDRSFSALTAQLVPAILDAAPESGKAVDIGCGAGQTAIGLAASNHQLEVVGLDISQGLVETARHRAEGLHNIIFKQGDAAIAASAYAPVDLYISRHGVMFFDDPVPAFTAFRGAASPGARMVFSCFRDWTLNGFAAEFMQFAGAPAPGEQPGPFAFAREERVRSILSQAGWRDIQAMPVDFDYIAGQGEDPVADAISFMRRIGPAARAIADADPSSHAGLLDGLQDICEKHRDHDSVIFPAAAWIWTARA